MRKTLAILSLVAGLATGPALADDHCFVPMSDWLPREAVAQLAKDNGWSVRRIRIDDGCYQIRGTDKDGRRIKVMLHPTTLEVMEFKYVEDDGRGRYRNHEHGRDQRRPDDHD